MPKKMSDDESGANENKATELLTHPSYEELLQKLDEAEQKANQHWERMLRMQADSENAARRAERDISNAHKYALEKFVGELLPVIDSLELCVSNASQGIQASDNAIIEGVNLTLKMFYSALEKYGVKQVNPVSEIFDPEFQQAISVQYDPLIEPGTVVSVLQKGYTLNNRLIRPALVVVSKAEK
ncbi:MAG: nucleotide exchange factor GrpE [Gammaproteobacteria bacterium]|nr:nucleotide exchange factor GrpE [Gammaproteobacteria bacterium]MCW5582993.1 nucleotide exchange factor GrpE [Gammaproteobacteria bacterium]